MEQLVDKGLCKAIGISNFTVKKTKTLLETAKIAPACNQGNDLNQYNTNNINESSQTHLIFNSSSKNKENRNCEEVYIPNLN